VHVQRHPAAHLLPLGHHLVALQAVVPALQLRAVDGVGDGERQAGRHVAVRQRVRPRQQRRRRRRVVRMQMLAAPLVHAQEQHLQLGRLEDRWPEQPRRLEINRDRTPIHHNQKPEQRKEQDRARRDGIGWESRTGTTYRLRRASQGRRWNTTTAPAPCCCCFLGWEIGSRDMVEAAAAMLSRILPFA
jgi:hypothetical protein